MKRSKLNIEVLQWRTEATVVIQMSFVLDGRMDLRDSMLPQEDVVVLLLAVVHHSRRTVRAELSGTV